MAYWPVQRIIAFQDIHNERKRQDAKWGEQNHPIRHEEDDQFYKEMAAKWRELCDMKAASGELTWFEIAMEEFFEAFAERDGVKQRRELVQCAAVLIAMIECIDRNKGG
jgi:HSP90 family molecular chaperone